MKEPGWAGLGSGGDGNMQGMMIWIGTEAMKRTGAKNRRVGFNLAFPRLHMYYYYYYHYCHGATCF